MSAVAQERKWDTSHLRPDSDDHAIWQDVYECDEYQLPRLDGRTVLDVGAHVGSFAARCLDEGAALVISVEPCTSSRQVFAAIHRRGIAEGKVTLLPFACLDRVDSFKLRPCPSRNHHSGSTIVLHSGDGPAVRTVSLGGLLQTFGPDVVKIDCEGAEYRSLMSCSVPPSVKLMYVEFHETGLFREAYGVIVGKLREQFAGEIIKESDLFHLWRFERQ